MPQTVVRLNGQNTRNDRAFDVELATVSDELEERTRAEEELRDDEIGAGVYLLFKVLQILLVARRVRVAVRVACHADHEVVAVLFPDEPHQVARVVEAVLLVLPFGAEWRIFFI